MIRTDTHRYRVISRETIHDDLASYDEAFQCLQCLEEQGRLHLEIEEYDPDARRLGRDPDLH
ncbi:uncharacterized protein METZ01_LOCUS287810 [marine metagenome]|uniref:Uncharacterized protein n=1 Tax=marine metagenome TaxID=408172 RepID=A0A382LE73_9ZZZZ